MLGLRCGIRAQFNRSIGVKLVRVVRSWKVFGRGRECMHKLCGWHLRGVSGLFSVLELPRGDIRFRDGSVVVRKLRSWNILRVDGGVIIVKLRKLPSRNICSHGRIERMLELRRGTVLRIGKRIEMRDLRCGPVPGTVGSSVVHKLSSGELLRSGRAFGADRSVRSWVLFGCRGEHMLELRRGHHSGDARPD